MTELNKTEKILFQCNNVRLHLLNPPENEKNEVTDIDFNTIIWKGSLRLIEQEDIDEEGLNYYRDYEKGDDGQYLIHAYAKSNLKLELYNGDYVWGETWYYPINSTKSELNLDNVSITLQKLKPISKDGQETIIRLRQDLYRLIVQIPGSGNIPLVGDKPNSNFQVALCLKLTNTKKAAKFETVINEYNVRYNDDQRKYHYIRMNYVINQLNFNLDDLEDSFEHHTLDDDKDEKGIDEEDAFGEFISS